MDFSRIFRYSEKVNKQKIYVIIYRHRRTSKRGEIYTI